MNAIELRATICLAGVFAARLLGLFMIYPIFAHYARALPGASPQMIGLALGAYGLTQALLQVPLGMLSDRFGRKTVISIGLAVFGLGSVVAALATSIEGVLLGRVLQGAGAVGSTILAMVADLTRDEVPANVVEHERGIMEQITRDEGKPEQAIPKIVEGRLNAFFKDVVLTEQPFVRDPKKSIKQLLADQGVTVRAFARFQVGQAG